MLFIAPLAVLLPHHFPPASISQYLLEKARVTQRNEGEANFHIFYAFLHGVDSAMRAALYVDPAHQYRYAQLAASPLSPGDGAEMFKETLAALEELAFPDEDRGNLLSMIAAVLHIGEIDFGTDETTDGAILTTPDRLAMGECYCCESPHTQTNYTPTITITINRAVAELLGVSDVALAESLTLSITMTRGERIARHNSEQDARDTRDTLAKELYGRVFEWLITTLNVHLSPKEDAIRLLADKGPLSRTIGVLDIFGFENFSYNCFEQLCINLANEQLQFYFNQHVFAWEAEEYAQEG